MVAGRVLGIMPFSSMVPITFVAVFVAGIFVDTSQLVTRLADRLEGLLGLEAVNSLRCGRRWLKYSRESTIGPS